jgi:hypothetical protein
MAQLVTVEEAYAHVLLPPPVAGSPITDIERDFANKLAQAQAIVLDYIGDNADPLWDATTAPEIVKAAILLEFGELHRFRGDDAKDSESEQTDGFLSPRITNLLRRLHDPAMA